MYGSDYSRGTQSVTIHSGVSAEGVTMPATGGMTVGCQALSNGANVFLLDLCDRLVAMEQLHVKGHVGWIQQHIPFCLTSREYRRQSKSLNGSS